MVDFHKRGIWLKGIARRLDDDRISDILCNYANQMINHQPDSRSSFLLRHRPESPDIMGRPLTHADRDEWEVENP